jgi:hypothetical protein
LRHPATLSAAVESGRLSRRLVRFRAHLLWIYARFRWTTGAACGQLASRAGVRRWVIGLPALVVAAVHLVAPEFSPAAVTVVHRPAIVVHLGQLEIHLVPPHPAARASTASTA